VSLQLLPRLASNPDPPDLCILSRAQLFLSIIFSLVFCYHLLLRKLVCLFY
jgi:hypothetical protein